ncbi:MobF family relaxase [Pseudoalteromonas galatheae]|uniref:MobF family relaxase n=1 Tax=Pseudoalteromonas galatheae TaxID=579562 RepID=UPI0030CA83D0
MLSIKKLSSSSEAGKYYDKADYYTKGESGVDISSQWFGHGASELNLNGPVDKGEFVKILEGNLPNGQSLARPSGDRVPGWDLTFSAPKSISILSLIGGDDRLLQAHFDSVKETLSFLEKEYLVSRMKVDDSIRMISSDKMVAALFTHTTSRALDPQLHTHSVIANATQGPEGEWRSIESSPIFKNKMLLGQVYRSELALRAQELGYEIDWNRQKGTFEIKGIESEVLSHFSQRRKEIKDYADDKGLEGGKELADAALKTRTAKKNVKSRDVIEGWEERANNLSFSPEKLVAESVEKSKYSIKSKSTANIENIVRIAYRNLSYNEAVFTRQNLINETFLFSRGEISTVQILSAIDNLEFKNELVRGQQNSNSKNQIAYTTQKAIDIEHHNLQLVSLGMNETGSIAREEDIKNGIASFNNVNPNKQLQPEQIESVTMALRSRDRVMGVQGYAGVGKSTSLRAFREIAELRGYNVKGFAPTGKAAQELQRSAGIESNTIDSLLETLNKSKSLSDRSGDVWVVDESSMSNSRHFNQLLSFSRKTNARLLLVGDKAQLSAVEQGMPFEQLQNEGISLAVMSNIQRQKNEDIRRAVFSAINGDVEGAFSSIKKSSSKDTGIVKVEDGQKRIEQAAEHYVELIQEAIKSGKTYEEAINSYAKLIIPDNDGRRVANEYVRKGLQQRGILPKDQLETLSYINTGMKPEERADALMYRKGMVVRFLSENKQLGVTENSYYKVEKVDEDKTQVHLIDKVGNRILWNPNTSGGREQYGVSVYETLPIKLAKGDFIRWRDKNIQAGLKNADVGKIVDIENSTMRLRLNDGREIIINSDDERYKHFEYEYASTVYAAQGDTYQKVVAKLDSHQKNLVNQSSFYVTLSRAVTDIKLYTDDEGKVIKRIANNEGKKTSALEATGYTYGQISKNSISGVTSVAHIRNIEDSVRDAISELSIKEAVFSRNDLIKLSIKNLRGAHDVYEINEIIDNLVNGKELLPARLDGSSNGIGAFTTGKSIIEEWRNFEYIKRGMNKVGSLADNVGIEQVFESSKFREVSPETKDSIKDILTNSDRFSGVLSQGRDNQLEALEHIKTAIELRGFNLKALNISSKQVNHLHQQIGVQSQTLSSFLHHMEKSSTKSSNDVWVVDQSQLLNSQDFGRLLSLADKVDARIIFTGDPEEISSIEKGSPLKQAIKSGMSSTQWQGNKEKDVIDNVQRLLANSVVVKDKEQRMNVAVKHYSELSRDERKDHVFWVPDKANREEANILIRESLAKKGELGKSNAPSVILDRVPLNIQQTKNPMNYVKGQFVKFYDGNLELDLKKGHYYQVIDRGLNQLTINVDGKARVINPSELEKLTGQGVSIYEKKDLNIAKGEMLRWRETNRSLGISSGEILTVDKVNKDGLVVINGDNESITLRNDELSHAHFNYAYTANHFDVSFGTYKTGSAIIESHRQNLLSQKTINTLMSSVRSGVTSFIDDEEKVVKAIAERESNKQSALESVGLNDSFERNEKASPTLNAITDLTPEEAVTKAVSHLYNNDAVFKRAEVLKTAIAFSGYSHQVLNAELDRQIKSGDLIQASIQHDGLSHDAMITTKSAYRRETYMLEIFKHGLGERSEVGRKGQLESLSEEFGFNEAQEKATTHLLFSKDSVLGIEGNESKQLYDTLAAFNKAATKNGLNVKAFSPRSEITERLSDGTGISAKNIQSFTTSLNNMKRLPILKKDVWVITASELLSTKEMTDILTLGRQTGARVILAADLKQNASIGQGMPFKILQNNGFKSSSLYVNDNTKSKTTRLAWSDAFAGHAAKALQKLDKDVLEVPDKGERMNKVINDYLSLPGEERKDYMVVFPSNKDRSKANEMIREGLKREGSIDATGQKIKVFENANLSKEQRGLALFYEPGMTVRFEKEFKRLGVSKGQYFKVTKVSDGLVTLTDENGMTLKWSPSKVAGATDRGVSVFYERQIEISKGDTLRVRENNKKLNKKTGDLATVSNIDSQQIELKFKDGKSHTISVNDNTIKHLSHSYAETYFSAHSAKGVKFIMGVIESYQKRLLNQKSFFTVLNKASERFYGYVDNKNKVRAQLEKSSGDKLNAMDLGKKPKEMEKGFMKTKGNVEKNKPEKRKNFMSRIGGKLFGGKDKSLSGPDL